MCPFRPDDSVKTAVKTKTTFKKNPNSEKDKNKNWSLRIMVRVQQIHNEIFKRQNIYRSQRTHGDYKRIIGQQLEN